MLCRPGEFATTAFANRTACEILGYGSFRDLLEHRGPQAFSHVGDAERQAIERHVGQLLRGECASCEFHHSVIRRDGSTGWIRGTAVLAGDAERPLIQAAFNDVTSLHERQYERDRDRYAATLCSSFDEVFEVDVAGDVSRLLGSQTRSGLVGTCLPLDDALKLWERRVIGEREREEAVSSVKGFMRGEEPSLTLTYRMRLDGRVLWTETTLMRLGREGFLCCNKDVTERMRREDEHLSRSIGDIVTRLPVGIGVFEIRDRQAVPLYVSDPVCEMLGYTREEFDLRIDAGTPLFSATALSSVQSAPPSSHGARRSVGAEVETARQDGEPVTLRVRGSLTHARSGVFTLFAAIADVTEEVRAQNAQAWQNERYRLLSELTGLISFDYDSRTGAALLYLDRGRGIEAQTIPRYLESLESARAGIVHEDGIALMRGLLADSDDRRSISFEYRADYRGDGFRWHRAHLFKVEDFDGVWHLIGIMEDIQKERDLIQKAESDLLTGVANHATTKRLVNKALADLELRGRCVCALIDVDDFKRVNDRLGHVKGDELLEAVGAIVRGACRSSDIVGRVGGDEFAVLFKGAKLDTALSRLEEIKDRALRLNERFPEALISLSIGVYAVEAPVDSYEEAVARADEALYASKRTGKNRISVYRAEG